METKTFDYRPRWTGISLAGLFFGVCSIFFFHRATTNDRGLVLNGIFHFETGGATVFYWGLFALSLGFVFAALLMILVRLTSRQVLELTTEHIVIPRSRFGRTSTPWTISLHEIEGVEVTEVYGQKFAYLAYPQGRAIIVASMLPEDKDFDSILNHLISTQNK